MKEEIKNEFGDKVSKITETNGREGVVRTFAEAIAEFVHESRMPVLIGARSEEPMIRVATIMPAKLTADLLREAADTLDRAANTGLEKKAHESLDRTPPEKRQPFVKGDGTDVFVDEGTDFLSRTVGSDEKLFQETIDTISEQLKLKQTGFIYMGIDAETGQATTLSNLDVGLQLEILHDMIENMKRVGQKA